MQGIFNALSGGISLSIFVLYHLIYIFLVQKKPNATSYGQNQLVRRIWIENVMSVNSPPDFRVNTAAVQTIRNGLMASSLLASTSITLSSAVCAYLMNTPVKKMSQVMYYQLFMLVLFFLSAFFSLMQSIRASMQASFAICIPIGSSDSFFDVGYVDRLLKGGDFFYTISTRAFYAAFIVLMWIFGPIPPLIGSFCIITTCWYLDIYSHKTTIKKLQDRK